MAYIKTVWKTGDVITAAKLNNAEDGIEAHDPIILSGEWEDETATHASYDYYYSIEFTDVTYADINDAIEAGKVIVLALPEIPDVLRAYSAQIILDFYLTSGPGGDGVYTDNSFISTYIPVGTALSDNVKLVKAQLK